MKYNAANNVQYFVRVLYCTNLLNGNLKEELFALERLMSLGLHCQ